MLRDLFVTSMAYASVLVLLMVAITAMLGDGTVKLDFNRWNEGWLEVGLLTTTAIFAPPIILRILRPA